MELNYYEWIYLFFTKDEEAFSLLSIYFKPLTLWIIHNRMNVIPSVWEVDEYEMEAHAILLDCLIRYREDRNCPFVRFYSRCLDRKLITIIRHNFFVSVESHYKIVNLDQRISEDISYYMVDKLYTDHIQSAHDDAMLKIQTDEVMELMNQTFSSYEMSVLSYKRDGYSTKEIAEKYKVPVRRIRYILTKMKKWYNQIDK